MSNLYERLERLCKEKGVTRAQMCKDTGISQGNVTDLKMGRKQSFSAKTLARIAHYFNVPIAYLLGDIEELPPAAATPSVPFKDGDEYLKRIEEGYVGEISPIEKGSLTITSDDFDELAGLWNTLKDRPEMKMLFKSANGATKEQVEAVVKMLESFNSKERQWED